MPTFKGLISEDGIMQIIAYLKSLKRGRRSTGKTMNDAIDGTRASII